MDEEISIFDKLLLRSKYKNKIQNLNDDIEDLETEISDLNDLVEDLKKERKTAVTEKQEAYEERNQLQNQIRELKDRVDRLKQKNSETVRSASDLQMININGESNIEQFTRTLSNISYQNRVAQTISFAENDPKIDDYDRFNTEILRDLSPIVLYEGPFGIIQFGVKTPLAPRSGSKQERQFHINQKLFRPGSNLIFGVVRSDIFAVGLYDGWDCVQKQSLVSNVKGNHSKGGFSQSRFEDSRQKQIDEHVSESKDILNDMLDNADGDNPTVVLVGTDEIVSEFDIADHKGVSDASGDPEMALNQAFNDFWSLEVYPTIHST